MAVDHGYRREEAVANDEHYPLESPDRPLPGMPRRFGVSVLLVVTALFAVLFGLLKALGVVPGGFVVIGTFVLGVIISQAIFFDGKWPKEASMLAGAILYPVETVAISIWTGELAQMKFSFNLLFIVLMLAMGGAFVGYFTWLLVAGVFLVIERLTGRSFHAPPEIELLAFTAADVDTLVAWVDSILLLTSWSRARFSHPLDRSIIESRLQSASADEPARLCFKAVYRHSQRMVGYVELDRIDRQSKSATVDLPLIDPKEPERGDLSVALLRAVAAMASGPLGLIHLDTDAPRMPIDSFKCYRMAGFLEELTIPGEYASRFTWESSVARIAAEQGGHNS